MPQVTFLPIQKTYEASKGESILDVALRNDVPMQHACGGFCACATCQVEVKSGDTSLSPMEDMEKERLDTSYGVTLRSRLSCQAKILGDVTVEIKNLD